MITREEFIEIINNLKETDDFVKETNEKARKLHNSIVSDFFDASSLSISHEDIVVKLLEDMFDNKDVISWWLYEKDYGQDESLKMWDEFGTEIDLSTAGKLYDYLVEEM